MCRETILWKYLNHAHILKLLGVVMLEYDEDLHIPCLVTPLMTHGGLLSYLSLYQDVGIGPLTKERQRLVSSHPSVQAR